ncbi:MAG: MerR family transcriptional regulator [Candidatus Sericytochromatia bacterium]|nr:MerR family transcriptional regulator [Candidatus Sericytochromatia bacterium]
MEEKLLIKDLCKLLDMNPKTVRFYEEIGVLPKAARNELNYRVYTKNDLKRLSFVKKARTLGLSIENIKNIIRIREEGKYPHDKVIDLLEAESKDLEQKIKDMIMFKEKLDKCIINFKEHIDVCKTGDICGLIEILFDQ